MRALQRNRLTRSPNPDGAARPARCRTTASAQRTTRGIGEFIMEAAGDRYLLPGIWSLLIEPRPECPDKSRLRRSLRHGCIAILARIVCSLRLALVDLCVSNRSAIQDLPLRVDLIKGCTSKKTYGSSQPFLALNSLARFMLFSCWPTGEDGDVITGFVAVAPHLHVFAGPVDHLFAYSLGHDEQL